MNPLRIDIRAKSKDYESLTTVNLNIRKETDKLVYREQVKEDEVSLAYLGMKEKTYKTEALITDYADTLVANLNKNTEFIDSYTEISGNSFIWPSLDILITDETLERDGIQYPVFYGMNLPNDTTSASLTSESKRYYSKYIDSGKVLISSQKSKLDKDTMEYDALYVSVIRSGGQEKRLFEGRPLFRKATIEDIDPVTLEYYPFRKVYEVEKLSDGRYRFTVNTRKPVYVKDVSSNRISIVKERKINRNEPWLLKVKEGAFKEGSNQYRINEFERQVFYPREPYVTLTTRGMLIGKGLIKVDEENLVINPEERIHCSVIIRDEQNNLKKAYTTNTAKIGRAFNRWSYEESNIKWERLNASADYANGVILTDVDFKMLSTDYLQVQYVIEEKYFRIKNLNLNPNYNNYATLCDWWIYVMPNKSLEQDTIGWIGFERAKDSRAIAGSDTALLGIRQEEFIKDYCIVNPYTKELQDNVKNWFVLAGVTVRENLNFNDALIKDIRLEPAVKNNKDLYVKHPYLFFNKEFSESPVEFADKKVLIFEVDKSRILEKDYNSAIKKNLESGYFSLTHNKIKPRIIDIKTDKTKQLTVSVMSEPESLSYKILLVKGSESTTLYEGNPGYARGVIELGPFDLSSEVSTSTIEIGLTKDSVQFGESIKIKV